ncbi:fatty acid desaturase 6-like [Mya arenaria]|uniref:fatty acid desaturase 6-like n=1 Tax=Mya arenaria TaxID=6604 RepID=UPI0022E97CF1|nr:fatty acid desaturase 6-like [Mya arenaria]
MANRSKRNTKVKQNEIFDEIKLDRIPKFTDLTAEVDYVIRKSSWWDRYGVDWALVVLFSGLWVTSVLFFKDRSWVGFSVGIFLMGWAHYALASKAGHIGTHGGMCETKAMRRPLSVLFVEMVGSFSEELAYDIHIKVHHPYTNIIGRGDSSTWKMPFLTRYIYLFVAPLMLPPLSPLVSIAGLLEKRTVTGLLKFLIRAGIGLWFQAYIITLVAGLSFTKALLVIWAARGLFSIPYIHVNIFQHIGLPMYAIESKPVRLYQMATGVLNLPSNLILDYAFGHSIISCHVEHHLFPKLSDNMCLKIKPIVSKFLKKHGLPYNEKTYTNRLWHFIEKYDTLMVNAPPITHFVGLQ